MVDGVSKVIDIFHIILRDISRGVLEIIEYAVVRCGQ